jgi:hypothetical protein
MFEKVTKELANKLQKVPGNVRGAVILENIGFLKRRGGQEMVQKIKEKFEEFDLTLSFKDIKPMQFYPEYYSVLIILLTAEFLDFQEQDIFEMGQESLQHSFFMKLFMNYFVSMERTFKESPKYWRKHFDFGEIEPVEFSGAKKYAIFRVKGYKFHPIMCIYHKGYFLKTAQIALGKKSISIEETKCMFRGDAYHEFKLQWK